MHYRAETVFVKQGRVIGRLWKNLEAVDKTAANSEMQRRLDEENGQEDQITELLVAVEALN